MKTYECAGLTPFRYRELLRAAVANTVADPLEVDGELRHLLDVLSR